ncbi:uncharacterized protein BX663DRAFT_502077, partial [Cokeromyces recurvatus]|uniref:uncharacterized protein n=1 Tax=Cokeromyces recurvatus TaxID=90255 RepID=UPI00221E8BF7
MEQRLIYYGFITIFIIIILFELNSSLSIISLQNTFNTDFETDNIPFHKDYRTLVIYFLVLSTASFILFFHSWLQQLKYKQAKLFTHSTFSNFNYSWLKYEWHLFQSVTFSCLDVIKVSLLFAINIWIWLNTTVNTYKGLEERHLYLQSLANGSAQLAVINVAFAVMLAARLSIIQRYFFGFDQTIRWHAWFGRLGCLQALYHATFQIQYKYDQTQSFVSTLSFNFRHVTGTCMLVAMITFILGSHPLVRYLSYRLFRITHLVSFISLIMLGCLHHWSFYVFYIIVLLFWVTDQIERTYKVKVGSLEALPANIIRLRCELPYDTSQIQAGQFVFISFQSSSIVKAVIFSHPFSICRIDENNQATFYIRANGRDTKGVYRIAERSSSQRETPFLLRISKPVGRGYVRYPGSGFSDYKTVVLVAEGMGITPWISLMHYLERKRHAIKTRSVHVIWSIHSIDTFYAFEQEFEYLVTSLQIDFHMEVYITGPFDPEENVSIPDNLTSIRFIASCRPHYHQLFKHIDENNQSNIALGICAHEESIVKASNLALGLSWAIRKERF